MSADRNEKTRALIRVLDTALQHREHDELLLVEKEMDDLGAQVGLDARESRQILEQLLDEGYVRFRDRSSGYGRLHAVAISSITEKGYALIDQRQVTTSQAGGQAVTFSGGTFGNISFSAQGPASITNSPVTQGLGDFKQLLSQLAEAIDQSTAPDEDKADAKLEAGQLQLELEKGRKNPERIMGYLKSIPALVQNSTAVVELADKIGQLARAMGWL